MNPIPSIPADTRDGGTTSLVTCGNPGELPCTLNDLYHTASLFGEYVLKIILPLAFFVGLFLTVWPIIKNPSVPENLAEAKSRLIKLLIGTGVVVGAYLIVRAVLVSLGVDEDSNILDRSVGGTSFYIPFVEVASAQADNVGKFENPLSAVSVQDVVRSVANIILYMGVIGVIFGYIRSGLLFVMSQERPENLNKAKKWLLWTSVVALVIFGAEMIYNIIESTTTSIFGSGSNNN